MSFKKNVLSFVVLIFFIEFLGVTVRVVTSKNPSCDIFHGSWVYDKRYPLYDPNDCALLDEKLACIYNRRRDELYLKQRWQPSSCDLPRLDGHSVYRMRNKKIMFVGDWFSKSQWHSLRCVFLNVIGMRPEITERDGIIEHFYLAFDNYLLYDQTRPYLVDIVNDPEMGRVLKLDSMMRGQVWKKQDVLIFNIWYAWLHSPMGEGYDYIQIGDKFFRSVDRLIAIEIVLNTWARWVDENINPSRTKVVFVGVVPSHRYGYQWGNQSARNCELETEPVRGSIYPGERDPVELLVKNVIRSIKKPVHLLDVTLLSQLRKDGHPGTYGADPRNPNCVDWCVPGVPDTWNELLSYILMNN